MPWRGDVRAGMAHIIWTIERPLARASYVLGTSDVRSADGQRRLSPDDPWLLLAFLLPAAAVLLSLMQTEDLAYQVRAGALMWQGKEILGPTRSHSPVAGMPRTISSGERN